MKDMTMVERLRFYTKYVENALEYSIKSENIRGQEIIFESVKYSTLSGGKRLRPALLLEFCRICGGDIEAALPFACAIEMIHTYSLIHDDLPCMDNDDYRRGKLTNHKVYGEALAVLAGDGLLTLAFETALKPQTCALLPADTVLKAAFVLARSAGMDGMVGGQVLDMQGGGNSDIETAQRLKTGALIEAAAQIGCIVAGAEPPQCEAAQKYASSLGLAFQLQDDILDITGKAEDLGKATQRDIAEGKNTFVSILGLEECKNKVKQLTELAVAALDVFEEKAFLTELAKFLAVRQK